MAVCYASALPTWIRKAREEIQKYFHYLKTTVSITSRHGNEYSHRGRVSIRSIREPDWKILKRIGTFLREANPRGMNLGWT